MDRTKMDACRAGVRVIGLILGVWGFLASLFLSFFLTFRVDVWQIFGSLMLPLIIILILNLLSCLCWIYGLAIHKTRFMLLSVVYWLIPLFFCIRFIWNPVRRSAVNTGDNMHYFNTEEDSLTARFEMTMPRSYYVTIYSALAIVFIVFCIMIYGFMFFTRTQSHHIDDPRFNVQNIYMGPSEHIEKGVSRPGKSREKV